MQSYKKPMAVIVDDVAEGIYLASGSAQNSASGSDGGNSGITYTLEQTNAWDGNKQYNITFINNTDKKVDSATVILKVKGKVNSISGNVTATLDGSRAVVSFNNWGNGIDANASTGSVYMAVTGEGDFGLE